MRIEPLTAVSPLDGRYRSAIEPLAEYFSEFALIRARVRVECEYLLALAEIGVGMRMLTDDEKEMLRKMQDISLEDASEVKEIEKETNHDVKAVEYFIKKKIVDTSLADTSEWVHFGLTSEDTNSIAYGLLLRDFFEHQFLGGPLRQIERALTALSDEYADAPMLARTHGQPASPTTFGKEMKVFLERLHRQVDKLKVSSILVKCGGATGNWNAHAIALPDVDWVAFSRGFVERFNAEGVDQKHYVRLELNEFTTQIEPHDTYAEFFDSVRRVNTILIDFSQDMWRYISDGWLTQKPKEGETGSSTMPHKVNPIDFENAEGNLGVANALFEHLSRKLPISRMQRDLSDSTVERSIGVAFAHSYVAYSSLVKGFGKISINTDAMLFVLQQHSEILAEAIQTVLRANGAEMPYEKLKELTRGRHVTAEDMRAFIDGLALPTAAKERLRMLQPEHYIGMAAQIARSTLQ